MMKASDLFFSVYRKYVNYIIFIILIMGLMTILNASLPWLSARVIDHGLMAHNQKKIVKYALISFGVCMSIYILSIVAETIRIRCYNAIQTDLKEKVYKKILSMHNSYFERFSATELFQKINEDIYTISSCFSAELFLAIIGGLSVLGITFMLIQVSGKLTLLMFAAVPIKLLKTVFFVKHGYAVAKAQIDAKGEYGNWFSEVVSGLEIIKCFNMEKYFHTSFLTVQRKIAKAQSDNLFYQKANEGIDSAITELMFLFAYIITGYYISYDRITIGAFISFQTFSLTALDLIEQFLNVAYQISLIKPSIDQFLEFMNYQEEKNDGDIKLSPGCNIEFRNVCFEYEKGVPIFVNANFVLRAGEHIAFIGGNGSGKTTLVKLILRFLEPQDGQIYVDKISVSEYDMCDYRRNFAVALQIPFLFCDSIRNNVSLFQEVSDDKIVAALDEVGLSEFVREKGLDYCVGQNGCELSGGQRQMLCLARVIISDSSVVILDEAEANIDWKYKQVLKSLLKKSLYNKTVILITHRNDILEYVDSVYLLDSLTHQIKEVGKNVYCDNR